jgi:hypothetical protein
LIRFLKTIEAQLPKRKAIHADNQTAHKYPQVLRCVEGFFAKLTRRRLKRALFRSLTELQGPSNRSLVESNENPKPFVADCRPTWRGGGDELSASGATSPRASRPQQPRQQRWLRWMTCAAVAPSGSTVALASCVGQRRGPWNLPSS